MLATCTKKVRQLTTFIVSSAYVPTKHSAMHKSVRAVHISYFPPPRQRNLCPSKLFLNSLVMEMICYTAVQPFTSAHPVRLHAQSFRDNR
jgi:hypothetical protein